MIKLRFWPFIPSPLRGALKTRGFPGFSSNGAKINITANLVSLDGKSLVARAVRTAEIAWLDDIRQGEDWLPSPLLPAAYAEMAVPIIAEEKVLGVVDVQEKHVGGKLRRIRDRADYLKEKSPAYEPFANKLHQLAQSFQERAILALIKKYLDT